MPAIPRFQAPLSFAEMREAWLANQHGAHEPWPEFARQFTRYLGTPYAVPTPSGRAGLAALLYAFDFPPGSEVIVPALTFHSVPAAVTQAGLRPRFVDIDPSTCCLDPAGLEAAVNPSTRAVIATHLYGRACDMERIARLAAEHGWKVIEDCAQSCGGGYRGRRLGSLGDAAYFSFGPTKNLSALWAGMITADSEPLIRRAAEWLSRLPRISTMALARRAIFALGMRGATQSLIWRGLMFPALKLFARFKIDPIEALTEETPQAEPGSDRPAYWMPGPFQGAVAQSQLAKLDHENGLRIRNGKLLRQLLEGTPGLQIPAAAPEGENIFMSFPVHVADRDRFRRRLLHLGVDTASGYMSACHTLPQYQPQAAAAPCALEAIPRMVHLPVYPALTSEQIEWIAQAVRTALTQ